MFTARTSLIQDRRAFLDQLNELGQAAAAVTLATGLPPSAIVSKSLPAEPMRKELLPTTAGELSQ